MVLNNVPNNNSFPADVNYITGKCLSTVTFSAEDIGSPLINSSLKTSPVSNPWIPVSTNYYQLPTKSLYLLKMVRS